MDKGQVLIVEDEAMLSVLMRHDGGNGLQRSRRGQVWRGCC